MSTDSTMTPTDKTSPASERVAVAWRVKDYADGWILCYSLETAQRQSENGNLIEPLFSLAQLEAVEARALAAEARVAVLKKALEPSADTKAAYIGEFSFGVTLRAGNQEDYRRIEVPWTTIKEIMGAISAFAARTALEPKP